MANLRFTSIVRALAVGIMIAAAGCQSATPMPSPRQAPRHENDGYHRPRNPYFNPRPILALDSAELNRMEMESGLASGRPLAWFEYRNDVRTSTIAGQYSPTLEIVSTYTQDRQYQHGDQVRDHYHQNTYRSSVKQMVR